MQQILGLSGILACSLLLASPHEISAQKSDASSALSRARAEYATVRSAKAEFTQEIKNPLAGRTLHSKGTLLQQKPGKISVTFSQPDGDKIVSDGKWLWIYIPSSAPGQVMRMSAGEGGTGNVDLAASVLGESENAYTLSDAGKKEVLGRKVTGVNLVGRPGQEVAFPRAVLWVDDEDSSVREVSVTDAQGVSRTIRITSWQKNAPVKSSDFTFQVPQGVRVIDQF